MDVTHHFLLGLASRCIQLYRVVKRCVYLDLPGFKVTLWQTSCDGSAAVAFPV